MFARPGPATAVATYIAIVGIVYSLVLRTLWQPTGAQLIADRLLHDAMPIVYLGYWLCFVPKGRLAWSDVGAWLAFPAAYALYTLARGAVTGRYPYPFLDVAALGYPRVALNAVMLVAAFLVTGLVFVALDRALGRRRAARASVTGASAP